MRILAIRGQNLASLAEPFEVDFEAEPIRTAGIFAICGPTGAGKSTLLDAMCLALFDRLPRFDHADGQARIGRADAEEALLQTYDDVRNVLRHGAAEGFAEVDFVGQDGRSYRARWQVRRARGRAEGRIQNQAVTLHDLESNQAIGDKKTETLAEIARRIGLNFQQFRRSVLLAQGDFDTFIKADAKARAELLERITGTGIYAEISKAAHVRRRSEEQALQAMEEQLSASPPLEAEARAAAKAAERQAWEHLAEIDRERERIAQAAAWHASRDQLETRLAQARQALGQAQALDEAEMPARAALAVSERAFAIRAEWDEARRRAAEADALRATLLRAQNDALEARRRCERITADRHAADQRLATARLEVERAAPVLARARELDGELARARGDVDSAAAESLRLQGELQAAKAAAEQAARDLQAATQTHDEHRQWLERHAALEALVPRVDDVLGDLDAWTGLGAAILRLQREGQGLARERGALAAATKEQTIQTEQLRIQIQDLERHCADIRGEAAAIDRPALQARLDQARMAQTALDQLVDAGREVRRAQAALVAIDQEERRDAESRCLAERDLARADAELPSMRGQMIEARRGHDLSAAAAGEQAQHLRSLLVEGQPCPVCHAVQHGKAGAAGVIAARARADQDRVAELEAAVEELQRIHAGAQARLEAIARAEASRAARRDAETADLAHGLRRFQEILAGLRPLDQVLGDSWRELPDDPSECDGAAMAGTAGQLERICQEAQASLLRRSELEAALQAQQAEGEALKASLTALEQTMRQGADRAQQLALEENLVRERCLAACREQEQAGARLQQILAGPLPDWREQQAKDHGAFAAKCRQQVAEWSARTGEKHRLAAFCAGLAARLAGQQEMVARQQQILAQAQGHLSRLVQERDRLMEMRAGLLEGRAADVVEASLRQAVQETDQAFQAATDSLALAEREQAVTRDGVARDERALEAGLAASLAAGQKLARVLEERQLEPTVVEQALERGEDWMAAERLRLATISRALDTSRATLQDREKALRDHEATGKPACPAEEVQKLRTELDSRREAAETAHRACWAILDRDDRIILEQAELLARLEARRAQADVWLRLAALVGSADGAKFRRFAQNLTLVQLLDLANLHLAELHPRYELQRAPGGDLVLQVIDRNMADEVRGVHSLSGGERFLISLALALGLASLSSGHGIRVESLFIDEGFGALDGQNLSMAVSALERLQATGRRVGVISHVEELKERIAVKVQVAPQGGGRSRVEVTF